MKEIFVSETAEDCTRTSTNGMGDATLTGYKVIREYDGESTMISNLQVKISRILRSSKPVISIVWCRKRPNLNLWIAEPNRTSVMWLTPLMGRI